MKKGDKYNEKHWEEMTSYLSEESKEKQGVLKSLEDEKGQLMEKYWKNMGKIRDKEMPDVELVWLASPMATLLLNEDGEKLHPESMNSADYNEVGSRVFNGFELDVLKYVKLGQKPWIHNVEIFKNIEIGPVCSPDGKTWAVIPFIPREPSHRDFRGWF